MVLGGVKGFFSYMLGVRFSEGNMVIYFDFRILGGV